VVIYTIANGKYAFGIIAIKKSHFLTGGILYYDISIQERYYPFYNLTCEAGME